jgi:hypothetical protein
MLTVTTEAQEWIKAQLKEAKAPEGLSLRLFEKEGQIQMGVSEPKEGDKTFEDDDKVFLAVGPSAAETLKDRSLCCQETPKGASLAIGAPAG